jgi:serine/threonine protein kinase
MSRWGPPVPLEASNAKIDITNSSANAAMAVHDDVELIDEMIWAQASDRHASNELAPRPRLETPDACGCFVDTDTVAHCCTDESCVLFACQEECHECLPQCANQHIAKKQWKPVEIFDAGPKGRGLRVLNDVKKGDFLLEYVGKAIQKLYLERLFSRYQNERMLYIMALDSDIFIDARQKGGTARYINHSCDPNCIVERWKVRGVLRAGIFALRDLPAGTELSFDYQWDRKRGRAATKCHCLSSNCRGTLEMPKSMEEEELERQLLGHWLKYKAENAGSEIINRSIRIYSEENGEYFSADVSKYDPDTKKHMIMYRNDFDEIWVDLSTENWQILDDEAEQMYVITKKQQKRPPAHTTTNGDINDASQAPGASLLGTGEQQQQPEAAMRHFVNYFYVTSEVKNVLQAKGFIDNVGRRFGCSADVERILKNTVVVDVSVDNDASGLNAVLEESIDGLVWKLTISGANLEKACGFIEKNISKLRQQNTAQQLQQQQQQSCSSAHNPNSNTITGAAAEVIIPRCTVDSVKKRLASFRERCRSVNINFAPSESKSKQFAKIQLDATLASDLAAAKEHLWNHVLLKACEEMNAPTAPSGFYKDLGFFGGELSSDRFQMLVNADGKINDYSINTTITALTSAQDRLSQEANQDLRRSSFFASFESTQRCTVWVQSEDDMGRIDASNRVIAEFDPNIPRKVYFGCPPGDVSKLWALVEQRANEHARGIRYFHLNGVDRMYQQFMMKNSGQFFEYIHKVTGATVTLDSMTGDHLRVDGGGNQSDFTVGDWDSEENLKPADRAFLAEELIRLQIELYRDHCIRHQNWIFGRDWSLASVSGSASGADKAENLSTPGAPKMVSRLLSNSKGNKFEPRAVANGCVEIAEIVLKLDIVSSVGAHAAVIMYRFLKIFGEQEENVNLSFKIREIVMACLFLANKAQKVNKWRKLDSLLDAAYPVFFPGSKFNRKEQEAINFEQKILFAESEILKMLNYDVFWKGIDWIARAAEESGHVAGPLAKNTLDIVLSGPVLAAGADLWLKYGVDYIFIAVAGFLSVNIEPLFEALSLIPLKVSQAAQLIADSVEANGNSRKSARTIFNGGKKSFLSNLTPIKNVCMQSMAKQTIRRSRNTLTAVGETSVRYQLIGQRDNRRLTFKEVSTTLLNETVIPIMDAICAESKCRFFVAESGKPGVEDIVLEGSWRALAIAEYLLMAACQNTGSPLPLPIDAFADDDSTSKLQSKTQSGIFAMSDVSTSEGWEGTIQSKVVADSPTFGRKVGGKACVAGRIQENHLRIAGLRWWIPPNFASSPSGSIHEMHCVRNPISKDDERLGHLIELAGVAHSLLGENSLKDEFPKLSLFVREKEGGERFVAVSMQRWPPEKIENKEQGKAEKIVSSGFSPAALQELQLLTQLHSLIPSPMGHPNFTLPVAVAMPKEVEENGDKSGEKEFGKAKVDDIFSLFSSSEENERRAQKEKKRKDRASGPHIIFNPIPFLLTRVLQRSSKNRRDDSQGTISTALFSAWFHDLLSALVHCHTNHVILRSAQSDQILIDHSGVAKLAGFYRATILPLNERDVPIDPLRSVRSRKDKKDDGDESSSPYAAPELLLGSLKHTKQTDIWAIGSMMAHLLLGKPLVVGKERSSLLLAMFKIIGTPAKDNYPEAAKFPFAVKPPKKYKRGVVKCFQRLLKEEDYEKHSKAIDLIAKMLHLDPKQRITAVDALKHEYMQTYTENCTTAKSFRDMYVNDWMAMKKELVHSDVDREKSLKRKKMLEAIADENDEADDLYDVDDLLGGGSDTKRQKI